MLVTLLVSCATCEGTKALKQAALDEGHNVTIELVKGSDDRTRKSASLGIGIPVLIGEDGSYSDDGKVWHGTVKKRTHVTHPVVEVVEDADDDKSE